MKEWFNLLLGVGLYLVVIIGGLIAVLVTR